MKHSYGLTTSYIKWMFDQCMKTLAIPCSFVGIETSYAEVFLWGCVAVTVGWLVLTIFHND